MNNMILIAAPSSNSGKTTVTLGLLRYFKNKGLRVQPFKCGPDYIDSIHHSKAAGTPSINLDSIMMSDGHLKEVATRYSAAADISIVEGVMGLFDGAVKDKGSSAEIAKKLDIPVVLVVNAKAMAYSAAPILYGFKNFDPEVRIAGVIFNFVKTASHYAFLKEAAEAVGIQSLGYLPPNETLEIPSRHLGLRIDNDIEQVLGKAAKHVAEHLDLDKDTNEIFSFSSTERMVEQPKRLDIDKGKVKIAVAKDAAFNFTYYENLKYLERLGTVTFFSPLEDAIVPEADMIYLAGGYPELHLAQLSANTSMRTSMKIAAEKGTKILAECGGMMYLGKEIVGENGIGFPMVGVFGFCTSMEAKKLHLGYRKVVLDSYEIWGHEFHYSNLREDRAETTCGKVYTARGKEVPTNLYTYKNVFASYIHFYWGHGDFSWLVEGLPKKTDR